MKSATGMTRCRRTGKMRSRGTMQLNQRQLLKIPIDENGTKTCPKWPALIPDGGCSGASQTKDRTDEVL